MLKVSGLGNGLLHDIQFSVAPGQCVSLSGPSGSGKTSLLRALADLDEHHGQISWQGQAQQDMPAHEWRRRIAYLPAESAWWFDYVREHFETLEPKWLQALNLHEAIQGALVSGVSSGERQRLALLRVISRVPEVLLLDEPTANLDEQTRELVERFVENYRLEQQAAVIWVGHDVQQLQRVATRHLIIDNNTVSERR